MHELDFINSVQGQISLMLKEIEEPDLNILFSFLDERISAPESFVVMLGETSSGKSTLINGLIESKELIVGVKPTTGNITEIMEDNSIDKFDYCAINKDATIENLSKDVFDKLQIKPDNSLLRLRLLINHFKYDLKNLRLFDTPGYGSILDNHEEIIKNFIPESDIVLYVVSYKVGFQNEDNNFVSFVNNLIDKDTKFYLIINKVPADINIPDNRICEITQHASDCIHQNLNPYIVRTINGVNNDPILPKAEELWNDMCKDLLSENRKKKISINYLNLQLDLLLEIETCINSKLLNYKIDKDSRTKIKDGLESLLSKENEIIKKIQKAFDNIRGKIPNLFEKAEIKIVKILEDEIMASNKWTSMEECNAFVSSHLIRINVEKQIQIIKYELELELSKLNDEINDILNSLLLKFELNIKTDAFEFENLIKSISKKYLQKASGYGLNSFFKIYGGTGGSGAGVANFAKRALKWSGDAIGKKFTRETHNALAKFLSKVGATSAKSVTAAGYIIIEALFYVNDALTWQTKLIKSCREGINVWSKDTLIKSMQDLYQLELSNIENIKSIFEDYKNTFDISTDNIEPENEEKFRTIVKSIEDLRNKIKTTLKSIN
jgi:GTP-binding protein EngB required for normal cell division